MRGAPASGATGSSTHKTRRRAGDSRAATFVGLAHHVFSMSAASRGSFANHLRTQSQVQHTRASARKADLFPLPLHAVKGCRAPAGGRARARWMLCRAAVHIANFAISYLNFEAEGRVPAQFSRGARRSKRLRLAQDAAASRILRSARSMCRASAGVATQRLGLGRGKLLSNWEHLELIRESISSLSVADGMPYNSAPAVGAPILQTLSGAEDVDVARLALPERGSVLNIQELLPAALREPFVSPTLLATPQADEAPSVRACSRVPAHQWVPLAHALDKAGILGVCDGDDNDAFGSSPPGGLFAVRKGWDPDRKVWSQRLILDRRPRNQLEQLVTTPYLRETLPHGSVWCETFLDEGEELKIWASDLPSFYYAIKVSEERCRYNDFTGPVPLDRFRGVPAVERFLLDHPTATRGRLCLNALAMGDLNATGFAQEAHLNLLREAGAIQNEIAYHKLFPDTDVASGVMIDDLIIVAKAQQGNEASPACRKAAELFEAALATYAKAGVPDVPDKRKVMQTRATVWGCELDGRTGTAGVPRERRAGLAAISLALCHCGTGTGALLSSLLGLWVDALLYCRPAFAILDACYAFVEEYGEDQTPRLLPGPVCTELLGLAATAPLLETNLRAQVQPVLWACDASLGGAGLVRTSLPACAARQLWRYRVRPGGPQAHGKRGFCFGGELADALPFHAYRAPKFKRRAHRGINLCEGVARQSALATLARDPRKHGTRQLVLYDSLVTVFGASRGRSHAAGLRRAQRRAYPYLLAADIQEGAIWCDSERNPADGPSRQQPVPIPGPQRKWVSELMEGSDAGLRARISELEQLSTHVPAGAPPDLSREYDRPLETWWARRNNARYERAAASCDSGYDKPLPRLVGQRGRRIGEAKVPGPPRARTAVDLRIAAQGSNDTVTRRSKLVNDFETWLCTGGHAPLDDWVRRPAELDELLCCYAQALWDGGAPQHRFPELLNAIAKRYSFIRGHLKGAWDVRTAWQVLEPGTNHAPVPEVLARALVCVALLWRWYDVAALLALTYDGALRPGDALHLQRQDLRFQEEHGGQYPVLFVILRFSKTATTRGARWQHVRISCPFVIALARFAFGTRPAQEQLFTYSGSPVVRLRGFQARFATLLNETGATYGDRHGFVLSGLRAGGITSLFERTQDLGLVRWRGRWDNTNSMEHYIQELPAATAFARLPEDARRKIFTLARLLHITFNLTTGAYFANR